MKFIRRIRHKPKEIRIVHGDESAKIALKKAIEQSFDARVIIPQITLHGTVEKSARST